MALVRSFPSSGIERYLDSCDIHVSLLLIMTAYLNSIYNWSLYCLASRFPALWPADWGCLGSFYSGYKCSLFYSREQDSACNMAGVLPLTSLDIELG